nr:hypothetical protein [Pseudomonas sp. HS-2]
MTNTAPYCLARRHANHQRIQEVATLSTGNKPVSYTHLDVYKRQRLGIG